MKIRISEATDRRLRKSVISSCKREFDACFFEWYSLASRFSDWLLISAV